MIDKISLILVIIGAINWGSIGLFKFDIVGWIFGGQDAIVSRIIFTIVALAGIWCIYNDGIRDPKNRKAKAFTDRFAVLF